MRKPAEYGTHARKVVERLRDLAAEGLTRNEAADRLLLSYGSVVQYAADAGIKFRRKPYTGGQKTDQARIDVMAALYRDGYTLQQIGDQFSLTRERVRQLLKRFRGMNALSGGAQIRLEETQRKRALALEAWCFGKYGCSAAQLTQLRAMGKAMMAAGCSYYRTPIGAFKQQKGNARQRGIEWQLTLWQWWTAWEQSGRWAQRKRGSGYVMCRKNDEGPYAIGNIYIALSAQNICDSRVKKSGLPLGVRLHRGSYRALRQINGRRCDLGAHSTPELAHAAYLLAAPTAYEAAQ